MTPLLQAGITSFTFHGDSLPALRDLDITAEPGTLTAVLGGSGSGKSTLGRLLAGWLSGGHAGVFCGSLQLGGPDGQHDGGPRLLFHGTADDPRINSAAWAAHVGYVPQDAAATLSTVRASVAEELAFGLENRGMPRADMQRAVAVAAERAGLAGLLARDPATLSGGELRRLAVACVAITGPRVLVLDEPLASLDEAGAASVRGLVRGMLGAGTAVIVLSQAADSLAQEASQWVVLDAGTVTARGTPLGLAGAAELLQSGVVLPGVPLPGAAPGVALPGTAGAGPDAAPARQPAAGLGLAVSGPGVPAVVDLEGIVFGFRSGSRSGHRAPRGNEAPGNVPTANIPAANVLQGLGLTVRPGQVVAVTGPNGAGKSTLLRHFNGLLRPDHGTVRVQGRDIAGVPTGTVAARVGLLFQHPGDQLFERTAFREARFGLEALFGADADSRAGAALAAVGLGGQLETHPHDLSASRQRLLALATVLAREPALLALDEPTVGLDRSGLARLGEAIARTAARGAAVVMVTHDLAYARATADRVLRLGGGRLTDI